MIRRLMCLILIFSLLLVKDQLDLVAILDGLTDPLLCCLKIMAVQLYANKSELFLNGCHAGAA